MVTRYFRAPRTLRCLYSGLAGPHIDGFADHLHEVGYAHSTIRRHLRSASHFGHWVEQVGLTLPTVSDDSLEVFRRHLPKCSCPDTSGKQTEAVVGAGLFLDHLRQLGVVTSISTAEKAEDPDGTEPKLLESFSRWMLQHRGVVPSTLDVYRRFLNPLLKSLGDDPALFDAKALRGFVVDRVDLHGRHQAKLLVTAVRMFLRYLVAEGHCSASLQSAMPTVAEWRLSALPRYLPACEIDRIIQACDGSTPAGARDRAIILLLSRLGLRAGDVAALRLADVDWNDASIRVMGKGRTETLLPLPQDVGEAIIVYLEQGRPDVDDGHIFLRVIAPWGPLPRRAISNIVSRAIHRAGVTAPSRGAHMLRHSAATAMLQQGGSLEGIASVLRHRSLETTAHYAKVDTQLLREIAQPWPEVLSC